MSNKKEANQAEIGQRLRDYRKEKNLNGNEFAKLCGISQGALSGLENGKSSPSSETIISLLNSTDIDIQWLLTGKERIREKYKNSYFDELEEWAIFTGGPGNIDWLKSQIDQAIPMFKEWRKRKEESEIGESRNVSSKVA